MKTTSSIIPRHTLHLSLTTAQLALDDNRQLILTTTKPRGTESISADTMRQQWLEAALLFAVTPTQPGPHIWHPVCMSLTVKRTATPIALEPAE